MIRNVKDRGETQEGMWRSGIRNVKDRGENQEGIL